MNKENKMEIPKFERKYVYFEKQSNDRLCGVHCLNSLTQGPYFDPVMLSEIGLKLDEMENNLYSGNFRQHENVSDDGNYNIQVLSEALKFYGAEIEPLRSREAIKLVEKNMDTVEAFIFNSSTHWFAIRKINNIWFNLNSTNSFPGPEIISDFYLSAFIQGTEDIGYTNFLVKKLPLLADIKSSTYKNLQPYQKLVTIEEIVKARESKKTTTKESKNEETNDNKKEDEKKFNAFTGKGIRLDESETKSNLNQFEDDEMKQAYELSLDEYVKELTSNLPQEPSEINSNIYNIIFKYSDQSFCRKFHNTDKIYDLINFMKIQIRTFSEIELFETFPRKIYNNDLLSLKEAGLSPNQILMVKLRY